MTKHIYRLAEHLQRQLMAIAQERAPEDWAHHAPRVVIDAWASLYRWNTTGETRWRISAAVADEIGDMILPPDLPLATAPVRAEAVAYQLPERGQWIVLARHAPAPATVIVHGDVRWTYAQPVLTYCTMVDGALASGYVSCADMPTAGALVLRPGLSLTIAGGAHARGAAEIAEEDWRLSLALLHHYRPEAFVA